MLMFGNMTIFTYVLWSTGADNKCEKKTILLKIPSITFEQAEEDIRFFRKNNPKMNVYGDWISQIPL